MGIEAEPCQCVDNGGTLCTTIQEVLGMGIFHMDHSSTSANNTLEADESLTYNHSQENISEESDMSISDTSFEDTIARAYGESEEASKRHIGEPGSIEKSKSMTGQRRLGINQRSKVTLKVKFKFEGATSQRRKSDFLRAWKKVWAPQDSLHSGMLKPTSQDPQVRSPPPAARMKHSKFKKIL